MKKYLATIVISWTAGMTANAATHTYRIYNHPASTLGVSCQESSEQYAKALGALEGISVKGALCEYSDVVKKHNIIIRYDADESLPLVSTFTFAATYDSKGTYRSEEECLKYLAWEESTFKKETGLEVFLSFCTRETLQSVRPWYAQVDGFGKANRVPNRLSWRTNAVYGVDGKDLLEDISESLSELGYSQKHVIFRPSGSFGKATVFFYGPKENERRSISSSELTTIPGLTDCQHQVTNLRAQLLDSAKINTITAYCTSAYSNPSRFEITLVYTGGGWLSEKYSSETFDDLSSCLQSEGTIGDRMKLVYGDDILATICGKKRFTSGRNSKFHVIGIH